jgi:hypothetical protein
LSLKTPVAFFWLWGLRVNKRRKGWAAAAAAAAGLLLSIDKFFLLLDGHWRVPGLRG